MCDTFCLQILYSGNEFHRTNSITKTESSDPQGKERSNTNVKMENYFKLKPMGPTVHSTIFVCAEYSKGHRFSMK